jgi:hypothetical protein
MTEYNTGAIQELLMAAFSSQDLEAFCQSHFYDVYNNFDRGMSKKEKVVALIDYCQRGNEMEKLLRLVKGANQAQYARFESRLTSQPPPTPTDSSPVATPPQPAPPPTGSEGGQSQATNEEKGRLWGPAQVWWAPIVVALIGGVCLIIATVIGLPDFITGKASPTPTTSSFIYQVRVQAQGTGEYIPNAEVRIEVGERAPLRSTTDTEGTAVISIDSSYAGQLGRLVVDAPGYKREEQFMNLTKGDLPAVVQLEPAP